MSYLPASLAAADPRAPRIPGWRPGGCVVSSLGDDTGLANPIATLAAQVNRFGAGAPAGYQVVTTPFELDAVNLSPALALTATTIYQRRATDAYNQFHDAGSAQAIADANAGLSAPVGFVSTRMAEMISTISQFADSLGLPPAAGAGLRSLIDPEHLPYAIGALALAIWLVTR